MQVGNNKYTTFQDAVNAVENNGTIEIVGGNKDYTATISGSSKTIKVKNSLTGENIKVTVNGESKTIKPSEDATFTYTKPSSGSSGGSSSGKTTYKVTTSAVNNGGVNASPSSAEKGATITITLSPDKGYKLDKLTVTDGSGKTVSTVKKSDTVYTFTMPASAVKVGVSYVKATETPSETKFNDVSANDWFASAVDYVTGKGMMNGTATTPSPRRRTPPAAWSLPCCTAWRTSRAPRWLPSRMWLPARTTQMRLPGRMLTASFPATAAASSARMTRLPASSLRLSCTATRSTRSTTFLWVRTPTFSPTTMHRA